MQLVNSTEIDCLKTKKLDDSNGNVSMIAKQHQMKQNDVVLLSDKGNDAVSKTTQ